MLQELVKAFETVELACLELDRIAAAVDQEECDERFLPLRRDLLRFAVDYEREILRRLGIEAP